MRGLVAASSAIHQPPPDDHPTCLRAARGGRCALRTDRLIEEMRMGADTSMAPKELSEKQVGGA